MSDWNVAFWFSALSLHCLCPAAALWLRGMQCLPSKSQVNAFRSLVDSGGYGIHAFWQPHHLPRLSRSLSSLETGVRSFDVSDRTELPRPFLPFVPSLWDPLSPSPPLHPLFLQFLRFLGVVPSICRVCPTLFLPFLRSFVLGLPGLPRVPPSPPPPLHSFRSFSPFVF
jgi:hypothetical protein